MANTQQPQYMSMEDTLALARQNALSNLVSQEKAQKEKRSWLVNLLGNLGGDAAGRALDAGFRINRPNGWQGMSFENQQAYLNDPTKFRIQRAADTGSILAGILAPGIGGAAAAGGLGTIGGANPNSGYGELLGQGAGGAALGGLTAWGLGGIGKGIKNLAGASEGKAVSTIDELIAKNQALPQGRKNALVDLYKQMGFRAQNTGANNIAKDLENQVLTTEAMREFFKLPRTAEGISGIGSAIGDARAAATEFLSTPKAIENGLFADTSNAAAKELHGGAAAQRITDILGADAVPQKMTAGQLDAIAQATRPGAQNYSKAISGNARAVVTSQNEIDAQLNKWAKKNLDQIMTKAGNTPGFEDVATKYSTFNQGFQSRYAQGKGIENAMNAKGEGPALGLSLNPVSILERQAVKGATKILPRARVAVGELPDKLVQLLGPITRTPTANTISSILSNPTAQKIAGNGISRALMGGGQQTNQPMENPQTTGDTSFSLSDALTQYYSQARQKNQAYFSKALSSGATVSEAKALADQYAPMPKDLASTDRQRIADIDNSMQQMEGLRSLISQNAGSVGPVAGTVSRISELLGNASTTKLRTSMDLIRQKLAKSLEGGKISNQDAVRYANMLTSMNQTPEQANQNIDAVEELLRGEQQSMLSTYLTR